MRLTFIFVFTSDVPYADTIKYHGTDMDVGPFSVTQPNPTQPTTYVVTRDPTKPNPTQHRTGT